MKALHAIALTLVIVGALNWGLVGLFDLNLVAALFGAESILSTVIYLLVGLAGLWSLTLFGKLRDDTHAAKAEARARHDATAPRGDATAPRGDAKAVTPTSPATARAKDMATAQTHATATPVAQADDRTADPTAAGTTHDPNSVTTGTTVEPTHDVFPPKGEDGGNRHLN